MTKIHSNGSKWLGQEPDSIDCLTEVMGRTPLDPTFAVNLGGFSTKQADGSVHFFGNFVNVSHCFSIETDEPDTIARLRHAIASNARTNAYREEYRRVTSYKR